MTQHQAPLLELCLSGLLVLAGGGCGEPPQKVPKQPSTPTMRFSGELILEGSLAKVPSGSIFLIIRQTGSRMPTLTRKYEIGDPLWIARGEARVLHFSIDERDNMGGAAAPGGEKMELEARYDPDGLIDTKEGTEKRVVEVRPGAADIALTLRAASEGQTAPGG